jgi:ankyrin repeat protein
VKQATLLLESGCDPVATSKDSYKMQPLQPLHLAARSGHAEIASVLLKQETVEINTKDGTGGRTALIWSCMEGYEGVVKLLLAREDVEVNAKDNVGKTALMWTSSSVTYSSFRERTARLLERHRCGCRR